MQRWMDDLFSYPMGAHTAFKSGQSLKTIVNESFAVINKCIEQFEMNYCNEHGLLELKYVDSLSQNRILVATISDVDTDCQRSSC